MWWRWRSWGIRRCAAPWWRSRESAPAGGGERRPPISTPGERVDPARRGPASILVSVAIHLVAIAILVRIAIVPLSWLEAPRSAEPEATHVDYVRTAADSAKQQRAGGDKRRVTNTPAAAP